MSKTRVTRVAILQEIGFNEYTTFYNPNCPIWVEGAGQTSQNFSILDIGVNIGDTLDAVENILELFEKAITGQPIYVVDDMKTRINDVFQSVGIMYRLSLRDIENITTMSLNMQLAPWQEARIPTHPEDLDANAPKAILVWLAYWVNYAMNLGATPFLKIGTVRL